MSQIIIEPHYLGSLEYFVLLSHYDEVCFEINDSFQKQTFRNRAYFLASNKIQTLSVPVKFSNGDKTHEVLIDNSQRWVKDHWGAFYSGYGKAPFFEYFAEELKTVWDKKWERLIDMNLAFLNLCFKLLQWRKDVSVTTEYEQFDNDQRNLISPKKPFSDRKIHTPTPYMQLFGHTFVPNLSIIDLLMNEGSNASNILNNSRF